VRLSSRGARGAASDEGSAGTVNDGSLGRRPESALGMTMSSRDDLGMAEATGPDALAMRGARKSAGAGAPRARSALLTLLVTLWPALAWAHVEKGRAEGLLAGLHHPVSGLDHVLAMVSVGLWGAQLGAPAVWLLPVTFPMVMAFGGMMGLIGIPLPGVEVGIALSGVLLGVAVLTEWRPPLAAAAVIVGFFAIFHGHAHGSELPVGASGMLYSIGFVVATGTLHAVGIGIGAIHRWAWGRTALRVAGAFVATAGVWFLWSALS
jgi:urease accessory protein